MKNKNLLDQFDIKLPRELDYHFVWPVRIYLEDTDAGGITYHASVLKFFERARTEFVRNLGIELRASFKDGVSYVVHSLSVNYLQPIMLDECVAVVIRLQRLGATYMQFSQSLYDAKGELKVSGEVKVACVDLDTLRPTRLPGELRDSLQTCMDDP